MSVKTRMLEMLQYYSIGQAAFEKRVGISNGYINNLKDSPGAKVISKIADAYPDLNIAWLLTGEGDMLKSELGEHTFSKAEEDYFARLDAFSKQKGLPESDITKALSFEYISKILREYDYLSASWLLTGRGAMLEGEMHVVNREPSAASVSQQTIPVYDLQMGGRTGSLFNEALTPVSYISLPNLPPCDGAICMYGDTMSPELKAGDMVVFKRIKNLRDGIFFGQMYLVTFEANGEECLMIKYLQPSENKDSVKLVSGNNRYSPQDVSLDAIKSVAMVKASVRYNTLI